MESTNGGDGPAPGNVPVAVEVEPGGPGAAGPVWVDPAQVGLGLLVALERINARLSGIEARVGDVERALLTLVEGSEQDAEMWSKSIEVLSRLADNVGQVLDAVRDSRGDDSDPFGVAWLRD